MTFAHYYYKVLYKEILKNCFTQRKKEEILSWLTFCTILFLWKHTDFGHCEEELRFYFSEEFLFFMNKRRILRRLFQFLMKVRIVLRKYDYYCNYSLSI